MKVLERQTLPVPTGHRVYIASDFSLSPTSRSTSRPIQEFTELLGDIDDAATVVVAGNFFYPDPTADIGKFVDATLKALPQLCEAISSFCTQENHRFIVLPGSDDSELATSQRAQELLEGLGACLASDLVLQVASANGVRDVSVTAGVVDKQIDTVPSSERSDADRLEDPTAVRRFSSSRLLYRRLGAWVWIPLVVLAVLDFLNTIANFISRVTHRDFDPHRLHSSDFWAEIFLNLIVFGALEAVLVAIAAFSVRRRFDKSTKDTPSPLLSEPLSLTRSGGIDALELARRIEERSGAGAIVGGSPRPALAFLSRAVSASPGPSRTVVVERQGRLGLPPVFTSVERFGIIEIEAASAVQIRLYAGETPLRRATWFERAVGAKEVLPAPNKTTEIIGSWPTGNPFPVSMERLTFQRRQRTIRRIASGLLFLDGLLDLLITAAPPLKSRLHNVLSILPLGVATSAAAVTAVAGISLVMLARGIRRGQKRSWFFAVGILTLSIFTHLARGGGVASVALALIILAVLVTERSHFQATTDRSGTSKSVLRLLGIGVLTVVASTFGTEVAQRNAHLPSLGVVFMACLERIGGVTSITLPDRIDDFLTPTLLAVGITLLVSILYLLTRPVVDRRLSNAATTPERRIAELRAREIVRRHGRGTLDYFALRDDKQFFFFRDSLVAYAVYGGVALVSPDPIGPTAERSEVFSAFRAFAEAQGWTIGVVGASEEWLPTYHSAGMHYLYVGDEAIVNCQTFSLEGGKMKGLRQACTRLARNGYTVEFLDPATISPAEVPELLELIEKLRRGDAERGFSMMLGRLFDPKDKGLLLTIVRGPDGKAAAVCQFVPSPAINGYSLDLMRRDPGDHPNGLIDYALCSTIAHLRETGGRGLSLNFAAFRSVLDGERGEGTFTRLERWTLKRLSGILPIETLWTFNSKYDPTWLPRHLVYPAAESFLPVAAATIRAESLTEIPLLGRFLSMDPANRPGTVVPPEVLEAAAQAEASTR